MGRRCNELGEVYDDEENGLSTDRAPTIRQMAEQLVDQVQAAATTVQMTTDKRVGERTADHVQRLKDEASE